MSSVNRDEFGSDFKNGPWIRGCPTFCTMTFATFVAVVLAAICGPLLEHWNATDYFKECYSSNVGSTTYYVDGKDFTKDDWAETDKVPVKKNKVSTPPSSSSCWVTIIYWPGKLWIRALKCLVSPLLATMMILLPAKLSEQLGNIGTWVGGLLLFTSSVAALEGLIWVNIFQPGKHISSDVVKDNKWLSAKYQKDYVTELEAFLGVFENAVPINIFSELVNLRPLGIISFFLLFGMYLARKDVPTDWSAPILNCSRGFLRCSISAIGSLMWFTPIAMFSIITTTLMKITDLNDVFTTIFWYVFTQLFGQSLHLFGFYFLFYFGMTRQNPLSFFLQICEAPMTALATSSSAATLPVTLRVNLAEKDPNDDYGKQVVKFVVPLGAAINMDGTSLGFPVMVMFVGQIGAEIYPDMDDMKFGEMLLVCLLAMVCSVGTAPIPNAGMVYLIMLLEAGNIKDEFLQTYGVGLVWIFDWLVDRVETAQNVTSDSFISKIIASRQLGTFALGSESELAKSGAANTGDC